MLVGSRIDFASCNGLSNLDLLWGSISFQAIPEFNVHPFTTVTLNIGRISGVFGCLLEKRE